MILFFRREGKSHGGVSKSNGSKLFDRNSKKRVSSSKIERSKRLPTSSQLKDGATSPNKSINIEFKSPFSFKVTNTAPAQPKKEVVKAKKERKREMVVPNTSSSSSSKKPKSTNNVEDFKNSTNSTDAKQGHVKQKVKASGSFLQRRIKNSSKSELRVLIPPAANNEEDDISSPITS